MAGNLIIYYSRKGNNYVNGEIRNLPKGNTAVVARFIQQAVDADLFEIETVKAYPTDYKACTEEAQKELMDNARPELKRYLTDITAYDRIVVAGPCWWGTYPMAIVSQLERLDFSGKQVFPVMTHEGSGLAGAPLALRTHCKGAAIGEGLAVHGAEAASSGEMVTRWATKNLR